LIAEFWLRSRQWKFRDFIL